MKNPERMVSDELLKCFIASNPLFIRRIHSIQMKELVSCKYLTLSSRACISFFCMQMSQLEHPACICDVTIKAEFELRNQI